MQNGVYKGTTAGWSEMTTDEKKPQYPLLANCFNTSQLIHKMECYAAVIEHNEGILLCRHAD